MHDNSPTSPSSSPIVARAGTYYRNARYVMFIILVGYGLWSLYDGFVRYPKVNAAAIARGQAEPHPGWDVPFNKTLGLILIPLGFFILYRVLRVSRGEYRLDNETLQIPGHPPIPLDSIRRIDRTLWDRKGIAWIDYELPDGKTGRFKLDDFVYDREPTDQIFTAIEAHAKRLLGEESS